MTYPKYYLVNNLPIIFTKENDKVLGKTPSGKQFTDKQAAAKGTEITKEKYNEYLDKYFTYPKYFNVNDLPVIMKLEKDEVVCKVANGVPYGIGKAMADGYRITKAEYDRLAKKLFS